MKSRTVFKVSESSYHQQLNLRLSPIFTEKSVFFNQSLLTPVSLNVGMITNK